MDIKDFVLGRQRMCKYYDCDNDCISKSGEYCPLENYPCDSIDSITDDVVDTVERWVKEHPMKTRQIEFLKHYPNARLDNGVIEICPESVDKGCKVNCNITTCYLCYRKYWLEEIE